MRTADSPKTLLPVLGLIFVTLLFVMFVFEWTKQALDPGISAWESHTVTIIFTSVMALFVVYLPLRASYREQQRAREAEERFQKTEAQYRSFVESVDDSIYTVDRECRYLMINKKHLDRRGLSSLGYAGKSYGDLHAPAETKIFEDQVRLVVAGRRPVQAEYEDDGRYFLRSLYPVTDPATGEVSAVTVISSEITEHKRAEESLALANKKLLLLLGITRHDIRNQLLSLNGYLELSRESLSDRDRTADFIDRELAIAGTITQQISFTSDYEEMGAKVPAWQNVSAKIKKIAGLLPLKGVTVDAGDPALEILADPLLEKVFYNLIDNALRYGGETLTAIRVSSAIRDGGLVLVFEDNGAGIPAGEKNEIFLRGYGKNTGLGLFLAREILSLTGIGIKETGTEGHGARFEMTVPEGAYRFVPRVP